MPDRINQILGPDGAIARRLGAAYEHRPQQVEMANAVAHALDVARPLIIEAGTGVGKSFAYLIPAIEYAVTQRKRVIISTHTISLQEQLIEKDIPLIRAVYPDEFSAVLVKGRGNYLCKRRLEQSRARQHQLFEHDRQLDSLYDIEQWALDTQDGSLSSLPVVPEQSVWETVNAEQGNCLGKKCTHYKNCHWQSAKRRMQSGQLLIVNHALYFSDLALRMSGVNYLPKYDAVIFDEAHTIEDVAGRHFGIRLGEGTIKYLLRSLFDIKRQTGILSSHGALASASIRQVVELVPKVDVFFDRIAWWQQTHGRENGRVHEPVGLPNELTPALNDLAKYLKEMTVALGSNEESVAEISTLANKIGLMAETVDILMNHTLPEAVYWFELSKRSPRRVVMHAAPVDVADGLRRHLFNVIPRVVLTSATLATEATSSGPTNASRANKTTGAKRAETRANNDDDSSTVTVVAKDFEGDSRQAGDDADATAGAGRNVDKAFAYIQRRLGLEEADTRQLGSPFDYANQVTLYIENDLPDPSDKLRFLPAACQQIAKYLRQTEGGAFVLFTSYAMLIEAANIMKPVLAEMSLPLLVQGYAAPRRLLLEQFKEVPNAVLFGTGAFWQGIDVPGDTLRNVIIVKLPFAVPDEPLIEAKLEWVRRRGGNPFMDLSVPEAVIKLKQGFGRLIRGHGDTGIVVLLDGRVRTKRYGRAFLRALPPCRVEDVKQ